MQNINTNGILKQRFFFLCKMYEENKVTGLPVQCKIK